MLFSKRGADLDIAIEGPGFIQVLDPQTQQTVYTRSGNLDINANGNLVIGSALTGRPIEPPIVIPPDATKIEIRATVTFVFVLRVSLNSSR